MLLYNVGMSAKGRPGDLSEVTCPLATTAEGRHCKSPATSSHRLHSREKELIYNVCDFFSEETANRGPIIARLNKYSSSMKFDHNFTNILNCVSEVSSEMLAVCTPCQSCRK